jgi:hypothetical protein
VSASIDHLVYATPNLDETVAALSERLGVRAAAGGSHPGRGTRNALIGLGPRCYLEIIGPDVDQPPPPRPRWFSIDELRVPRLVAWAVGDADLEKRAAEAAAANLALGPIVSGSRQRPDGQLLSWRFTDPAVRAADGVIPFFIDWGEGAHPADVLPAAIQLAGFRAEHPDSGALQFIQRLGANVTVRSGERPRLAAILLTPNGPVELQATLTGPPATGRE